ncbi:ExeM/NucH family extracellular endonuclease [Zhihengliuella sp.]|uniref:ExeM/NucH family extracellular endonuclease n=1 Tax=Zhihengliuella sp. TaxID=1954483 RepID=UPI002811B428|nr:ExeM/NucH family extracellular endonuclease [Zhihengliuella sp.]
MHPHPTRPAAVAATLALAAALTVAPAASAAPAAPAPTASATASGVVINEAYLSGGSRNAVYTHKFVELLNTSGAPVSLEGWSLQYRSASGTAATHSSVELSGTIDPGETFLVAGGSNGTTGAALPGPDLTTSFNPGGTNGTVVLAETTEPLTLPTGSVVGVEDVADLLGYGGSNTFETQTAAAPSSNSDPRSFNRTDGVDTDDNRADFTLSAEITPTPSGGTGGPGTTPEPEPEPAQEVSIAEIQGTGAASPLSGERVSTRGVVTAAFPTGGIDGFFLQTPGTGSDDGDAASHGVFVYAPDAVPGVVVGDHVEVTGTATEYYGMTQVDATEGQVSALDEPAEAVKPLTAAWPATDAERERYEGMLWQPEGQWTVADNYSLNRYGEIGLAFGESALVPGEARLPQPTDAAPAGSDLASAIEAENAQRSVTLDDGATVNFTGGSRNQDIPLPYLSPGTPVRVGAAATFTSPVVLDYRYDLWRFQPQTQVTGENPGDAPASFADTRTTAPAEVGGDVRIASFNVLNYFTTTGREFVEELGGSCSWHTDRDGEPVGTNRCNPDGPRGAADEEDLERQEAKIVAAINGLGADVVSLEEIENSAAFGQDRDEALATLTAALNEGAGTPVWDFVPSPADLPADEDVIRTAFIFKPAAVKPIDESVILDDPAFSNARQPLAQAFQKVGGNSKTRFLTIVNHFKSKGSAPDDGSANDDAGDGQGAWNAARVAQAEALVAFAEEMTQERNTEKVFLTGDFNAYTQEDPMRVFHAAGYTNLGAAADGEKEHTYLYGGLVGSLDHILASPAAAGQVTGHTVWDINADEPIALEYSRYNYNATDFYAPDPYRASDHDPAIVGVDLPKK